MQQCKLTASSWQALRMHVQAWREQCRTEASTEVVAKYMTHLRQARTASHSKQAALDARVAEGDRLRAELLQVRGQVRQLQDKHRLLQSDLRSAHQSLAAAQVCHPTSTV